MLEVYNKAKKKSYIKSKTYELLATLRWLAGKVKMYFSFENSG